MDNLLVCMYILCVGTFTFVCTHTHKHTHAYIRNIFNAVLQCPRQKNTHLSAKSTYRSTKNPILPQRTQFFRQRSPFLRKRVISHEKKRKSLLFCVQSRPMVPFCDGSFAETSLSLVNTNLFSSAYSLFRRLFCKGSFKQIFFKIFSAKEPVLCFCG